ncbi:MAG: mannose-6-phosphate isomerase, class I [Sediminibacterium sp.]
MQHYAWGGLEFLPSLLGLPNPGKLPFAEYWMGAHASAPSELVLPEGGLSLLELIRADPSAMLSEEVFKRFGELPYLLKVLDVKNMLSIQVHPSKSEAEKGFDREEAAGIPINAPNRNYKDRNHKPEVMVALSEFWLLHGFRTKSQLERILNEVPEFNVLLPLFKREGYRSLYQLVMEMEQPEVNALLTTLVKRALRQKQENELTKDQPGWWVAKLFEGKEEIGDIDRGVFSIYFFNIVAVKPGQAVFQPAGVPHAYLEGQNIELMANSDNVLRGGLTPKYIDVAELMQHTLFEEVVPVVMAGIPVLTGETLYACPVPDFSICKIELTGSIAYTNQAKSLEIMIVTAGGGLINNSIVLKRGEAVAVLPGETYTIQSSGQCTLFRAFVSLT